MQRLRKFSVALLCLMLVIAASALLTSPGKEPEPIASKPWAGAAFVSNPDVHPQPLTGFLAEPQVHPYMAFEGGGLHGNHYNSDVHVTSGPLGHNLQIKTRSVSALPGGLCPTVTFAKSGLLVAMCASFLGFELNLFEPHTLNLLATHRLVTRPSTFEALVKLNLDPIFLDTSGGSYFYLDNEDRAVLADANQVIQRIAHRQKANGDWEFYVTDAWDMKA